MKKIISCLFLFFVISGINAQDWMTSLDVAQRLARIQDKLIFAMWEESTYYDFPVKLVDDNGNLVITDLFQDEKINTILWEYFIPVRLPEFKYDELFNKIDGKRSNKYVDKFIDDSIKIMDANGNILNINEANVEILDMRKFIDKYAFNIVYLKPSLSNYANSKSYSTAYRLAMKYYDFAIFNDKALKKELIELGTIYLNEAITLVSPGAQRSIDLQRCELSELKTYLILNKPKKVIRTLQKMEEEIDDSNKGLHAFLYYTAFKLQEKDEEAESWKSQVSLVDLKKTQLIINSTK